MNWNKYNARKIRSGGEVFDSLKEYRRWQELTLLQKAGEITGLQRQVKYTLIPEQREPDTRGPRGGLRKGRLLERGCYYIADFIYFDRTLDRQVVEDVKGYRDGVAYQVFKIKRKLMLERHHIRIKEV